MTEHVSNEMMAEAQGWRGDIRPSQEVMKPYKENWRLFNNNTIPRITWLSECNDNMFDGTCAHTLQEAKGKYYPDITHSLDLIREIENTLTREERKSYVSNLYKLATFDGDVSTMWAKYWYCINATTQQKCDAIFPILQARHDA
jgi:hypothetical protein